MSYASSMIDSSLDLKNVKVADMDYSQQFQQGVSNTVVKSAVDSAVYGTDFEDSFKSNLGTTLQATLSSNIGDSYFKGDTNYLEHKGLHALSGAIGSAVSGNDVASGALGAVTGEVIGEAVGTNLIQDGEFSDRDKDLVRLSSQLGTIGVAGLAGKDADTALNSSNVAVENNLFQLLPLLALGVTATQSYLNAPEDEKDVKTGTTGSENLLLGAGLASNTGKIYETGKQAVQTVLKYDPSLTLTGAGVATGTSAYTNYDKYDGAEYATHVATDGAISFLVGKFMPAGNSIGTSIGYGTLGGGLSGALTEGLHQASDTYVFDNQANMNYQNIFLNSAIEGTAGATGKFYNSMGNMMNGGHIINDAIDLGVSQSFKPVIESQRNSLDNQTKQENE